MNDVPSSRADASPPAAPAFFLRLLDQLPFGVVVYHLDEPDDPGSLRLLQANDAASRAIGFDAKAEIGKTFRESLPQMLETDIPVRYAEVARTGVGQDLGEIAYGDERVEPGVFQVQAFPLPGGHVGVAFSEVTQRKAAENRLRLLTSALENAHDSVVITGPHLDEPGPEILYVNPAFTALTGYALDEVVGKTPRILQGPDTDRAVLDRLRARLERGEPFAGETINYRKDGSPFVMNWDVAPIRDAAGIPTHWVATQRDVTERRRAEERLRESETELRSLAEAAFEGIVLTENGRILLVNERFAEMMGYAVEELVGTNPSEEGLFTVAPEVRAEVAARLRENLEGSYETMLRRKDGSTVGLEIGVHRIEQEGRAVFCTTAHDLTEQQQVRAELEAAKEHAEEMLRLKSAFLNNMSHELRTPLVSILGFAELLADEADEEQQEIAGTIHRSAQRLHDTLNSVLDLAQLESGGVQLDLGVVDVGEEVARIAGQFRPLAAAKGLALRVKTAPEARVFVDPVGLRRILTHLLTNAVKFTEAGGIGLDVEADSHRVLIRVSDTGIGISDDFLPRLFGEFEQASTGMDRCYEGSGLGLTITKRLVDLMGGRIAVKSVFREGTMFVVAFPRTWALPEAETPSTWDGPTTGPAAQPPCGPSLLFVNDKYW